MSNPEVEGVEDAPLSLFRSELSCSGTEQAASAQYLANLVFLSYRFSQGGIGTQNRILLYLEENFHPGLMVGEQVELIKTLTYKMVGRYFLDQRLHPSTAIPWEDGSSEAPIKTERLVINELTSLFERFEDRKQIANFTSDKAGIAQSVIVMDADYLSRPGGRAGDSKDLKIVVGSYNRDPYDSLFIKYSVLGASTKTLEFDNIFHTLATREIMQQFDQYTLILLLFIIDIYIRHHPGTEINSHIAGFKAQCMELLHGQRPPTIQPRNGKMEDFE